jgi:tetratricopeptide (TPR) repeat protein
VVALLFLQSVTAQNSFQKNLNYLYDQCYEKFENQDFEGALEDCETAIAICPVCVDTYLLKIKIYNATKKFKLAYIALSKAKKLSPNNILNDLYLAYIKIAESKIKEGYKIIQKNIDEDSNRLDVLFWYYERGEISLMLRNDSAAYKDFSKIYELIPTDNNALAKIFQLEVLFHQNEKVQLHLKQLVLNKETKDTALFYYDKGSVFYLLKKYDTAIENLSSCIAISKNAYNAIMVRGICFAYLHKNIEALQDANDALKIRPNNAFLNNSKGFIHILLNNYDSAIIYLQKAIQLGSKEPELYNNLGYIYYKLYGYTNNEKAVAYFDKAIEIGGKNYQPYWKYKDKNGLLKEMPIEPNN